MNKSHFVGEGAGAANQDAPCDGLPEHFHPKNVRDDLLGFPGEIWVCESHVVVASNAVAEGGEPLVDTLDDHLIRQAILEVLELLVVGGVW